MHVPDACLVLIKSEEGLVSLERQTVVRRYVGAVG